MLEENIKNIITAATKVTSSVATSIAVHLISDKVGVAELADLKEVKESFLDHFNLPPITIGKLMRAFKSQIEETENRENASQQQQPGCSKDSNPQPRRRTFNEAFSTEYSYTVPWSSLNRTLLSSFEGKEFSGERAEPDDEAEFRLAIAKKLRLDYKAFKESHPGLQKHPGVKIYKSVAEQVFDKFPNCFQDKINGNDVGNGVKTFAKLFKACVENQLRDKSQPSRSRAVRAKGVVGVLANEYEPNVVNEGLQRELKDKLQNLHKTNPDHWNKQEIKQDMKNTYELQRQDIVIAKEKVEEEGRKENEKDNSGNTDEQEDIPPTKAILELQQEWPFLFEEEFLSLHHKRLTGRELYPYVIEFMNAKLEYFLLYLCTAPKCGVTNLALRINSEAHFESAPFAPKKFLCFVFMIANYFKEDKSNLVLPIEKTIMLSEVQLETREPCILATDENVFQADRYYLCVDGVGIMAVDDFAQALVTLVELCFIFDLQYPKMNLTFEFIERYIFQMAIANTRVKDKRGKELMVLTTAVRDFINAQEKFTKELLQQKN